MYRNYSSFGNDGLFSFGPLSTFLRIGKSSIKCFVVTKVSLQHDVLDNVFFVSFACRVSTCYILFV